ncbi:unnamed protein product [Didymodactylos carnosus]|uniref:Uncharacterized protein n=1 Tax=Didymodactylos carnosus TaxID=1234261 RepID=A0A814U5Z2_9BILA|nr:unnamed protein product [Didymodactylos carnosus]CAF1172058.1 unnamed protein product [Didymodactylos carnosus]CAF3935985.1 unnamed protein product [Didymodactylos carnosus]CAF3973308.1 unnamed protein product [Didymodactylos carnosus]
MSAPFFINSQSVLLLGLIITTIAAVQIPKCFNDVSGIYLRKFNTGNDYSLLFYFPLGGVLQLDSTAKLNSNQYFSDRIGFYNCSQSSNGGTKQMLRFNGIYFGESGNKSIGLTKSMSTCQGASNDCSDDVVQCPKGNVSTQFYKFEAPDPKTGVYTHPIPPKTNRQYQSQRLYTHPTVTLTETRDTCYSKMGGIYVVRYANGIYALVAFTPLGYLISVTSNKRNKDGTFNRGTSVGIWFCSTTSQSMSGQSNYFTYPANTQTKGQKMISSTFYIQCPSSTSYDNCLGTQQELVSRLYVTPIIKSCHLTYSGIYSITITITTPFKLTVQSVLILYRNGVVFGAGQNENEPQNPTGNTLGTWQCTSKTITFKAIYIGYTSATRTAPIFIATNNKLTCQQNTRCSGNYADNNYALQLPLNGTFSNKPTASINGTVTIRKLDYKE